MSENCNRGCTAHLNDSTECEEEEDAISFDKTSLALFSVALLSIMKFETFSNGFEEWVDILDTLFMIDDVQFAYVVAFPSLISFIPVIKFFSLETVTP